MSTDSKFFDQIVRATGIELDVARIDEPAVTECLDWSYGLTGALTRIDTEKDDTFLLDTGNRRFLVKVAPHAEDPAVVNLQSAAMLHLEETAPHLPVQRLIRGVDGQMETPIADAQGRPRVLRVMSYLEGPLLRGAVSTASQLQSVGAMMARVDNALATFHHPADDRLLLWDMRFFPHMRRLVDHVADPADRDLAHHLFDEFDRRVTPVLSSLESQVIHGDFSPFNIVVDEQVPEFVSGVIDFGDVMRSAVLFELGVAVANQLGRDESDPWAQATEIVRGYRQVRPVDPETVELLAVAGPARLLLRALVYGWRAVVDPASRDYGLLHSAQDWRGLRLALAVGDAAIRERLAETGRTHVC
ncbi:phosphotransferase [Mycolicibacterium vaccae]|uniref:phosphotransferase n=1 Tax=Mycolicibacterium vaccae TaxID=1810 RepID=UPI003D04A3AF